MYIYMYIHLHTGCCPCCTMHLFPSLVLLFQSKGTLASSGISTSGDIYIYVCVCIYIYIHIYTYIYIVSLLLAGCMYFYSRTILFTHICAESHTKHLYLHSDLRTLLFIHTHVESHPVQVDPESHSQQVNRRAAAVISHNFCVF